MLKLVTEFNLPLNKSHNYFLYILIFTSIVMCISGSFYPERSARIYAKLVHKMWLKRKEIEHQTCFQDTIYAIQMNDRVMLYLEESYLKGTQQFLKKKKDIYNLVLKGNLILIEQNEYYMLDTMWYSYPYLIPQAKDFLDELGQRFQLKLQNTGLECTQFTITSMLRNTNSVARL